MKKLIVGALIVFLVLLFIESNVLNLGLRRKLAFGHILTATIASILIIYLAVQFRLKKKEFHKEAAYLMAVFGILSLYYSLLYGFTLKFSLDLIDIHNISGFAALILSLVPMFVKPGGKNKLHCRIATASAVFAIISLITGIISYQHLIFRIFG